LGYDFRVDPSFVSLLENGGLIAALCAAVWFLNRRNDALTLKVEQNYDAQLTDVRRRLVACEQDREKLHDKIQSILKDQTGRE
tara:strand:+ start:586 stop:834 length:249 start_codon:yes stop_codon:yes gene_type:complete